NVFSMVFSGEWYGCASIRAWPGGAFSLTWFLSSAVEVLLRRAGPLIIRWRWPAWRSGLRVRLRGYVPSLRERIRPPASKAISLRAHLRERVRLFLSLAYKG